MTAKTGLGPLLLCSCILLINLVNLHSQSWQATGGPGGGFLPDLALHPTDTSIIYAVGRKDGFYKTVNYGESWVFKPFNIQLQEPQKRILIHDTNPDLIICSSNGDLAKSSDGGTSWKHLTNGFNPATKYHHVLVSDPLDPDGLYTAGGSHDPSYGPTVYYSDDYGENWVDIGSSLSLPNGVFVNVVCPMGEGNLLIGVNDESHLNWGTGKVFHSSNNGTSWNEIDYGQTEDRFIWSIHACAYDLSNIWLSEGPLYNTSILAPLLYNSTNSGISWQPVNNSTIPDGSSQMHVIGSSKTATNLYLAEGGNLFISNDNGVTFKDITFPAEILRVDLYYVYEQINNPDRLFSPTVADGIAFSSDQGSSWSLINEGILNTTINLISIDHDNSGRVFASSSKGEGLFKTEDYGESWERITQNGITHPYADELLIDPSNSSNIWYVADVPFIQKSSDAGNSWELLHNPYEAGNFNFSSIYALAQSNDNNTIYVANNGFGLFNGRRNGPGESFSWIFLNSSDIDYTYTLATEPGNGNILYAGYSRKPFEDHAKIRARYDRDSAWFTSLTVPGAEAVTSVEIDPVDNNNVFAASVGSEGILWKSNNKGQSWDTLNPLFNFTTIHAFDAFEDTVYAATWGGGMYKSVNMGIDWEKLSSKESTSVAVVAIAGNENEELFIADRTKPIIYKSLDGGFNWDTVFNAGPAYRRIMSFEIDPHNSSRIYATVMSASGPGIAGDLFKIGEGHHEIITNELPKLPLTVRVSPDNNMVLYSVIHESGVYKSIDGGESWIEISGESSGLPNSGFNDIVFDPNSPDTIFLLGGSDIRFSTLASAGLNPDSVMGIYKSVDGGLSWVNINQGILGGYSGSVKSMSFYNGSSDQIYVATENGIFYSTNGGDSWIEELELPYKTLGGISISGNTIHGFTHGAGVFTGTINGDFTVQWNPYMGFKNTIAFAQVLKHPLDPDILFASAYPGGIFKSYDQGSTWHERNFGIPSFSVNDPLREGYYALDINSNDPEVIYLGLFGKGIYRSFNGGDTWYPVNGSSQIMKDARITSLVSDISNDNTVYVGTLDGMYKTINGGESWSEFNTGMGKKEIRSLHINAYGELHAGTKGYGLYTLYNDSWMANAGVGQWGTFWPMWDNRPLYQYTSLLIHSEDSRRIMLGTFPQGIYLSEDEGLSWRESNIGWTNDGVFSLVSHPSNPEIVYAGTYNGINISFNFGQSWEMADNGWPAEQWVFSIDFDPEDPDIMYACSKNGEDKGQGKDGFRGTVMKSTNGGESWFSITGELDLDQEFYQVICDRNTPGVVFLSSQYDGIFRSQNGGESWTPFNTGLLEIQPGANNNVTNSLSLSADNSVLYYGTAGSGLYRSLLVPVLSAQELQLSPSNDDIELNWFFTDLTENFRSFNIYRSSTEITELSGVTQIHSIYGSDTLSFLDTAIVEEETYYYAVTVETTASYETESYPTAGPISIRVNNNPPKLAIPLVDQSVQTGEGFIYNIPSGSFIDPDNDDLNYTAFEVGFTSLPSWLNFDMQNQSFYGSPTDEVIGQSDIEVRAMDPFQAFASDTFNLVVTHAVGIIHNENVNLKLYPIPANGSVTIETPSTYGAFTIKIYDAYARQVVTKRNYYTHTDNNIIHIDISSLSDGTYVVVAESNGIYYYKKMLVQH